ncbi:Alpha/Beta hydrolase protein [Cerioporus squamosus]|nr:Alpha/Beta hydrolase protein [Cerioporus squamosus]
MPTAPVNEHGAVLYYEDSGFPCGVSSYVTIVLIHGTCFHSAIYRRMIPYAAEHNLRLVLLNLRGYPGSTPYFPSELDLLEGRSVAHDDTESPQDLALQARGMEVAEFLRWFVKTENISPIHEDPGSGKLLGGLSVLSWSGGNAATFAMFAHADKLPEETKTLFNAHLRSFIMYDPSSTAVGSPPPPGLKTVKVDRSATLEEQAMQFGLQVGSFYAPFTVSDNIEAARAHPPRLALQDYGESFDPKYAPSVTPPKMTPEEFKGMTHPPIMERLQHANWAAALNAAHAKNVFHTLCDCTSDDGSGMRKKVLPAVRMHVVWCDMTCGEAAWAVAVLKRHCFDHAHSPTAREVEFHLLEGANHFVQWEEPERFVKALAGVV